VLGLSFLKTGHPKAQNVQQRAPMIFGGASVRYVQSIEAGEYLPSRPTLARLKFVLRCSWNVLFDGCDKM
jgi:hypothetical protein